MRKEELKIGTDYAVGKPWETPKRFTFVGERVVEKGVFRNRWSLDTKTVEAKALVFEGHSGHEVLHLETARDVRLPWDEYALRKQREQDDRDAREMAKDRILSLAAEVFGGYDPRPTSKDGKTVRVTLTIEDLRWLRERLDVADRWLAAPAPGKRLRERLEDK